jgi:DNA-binding MarR family transcriptional regulator
MELSSVLKVDKTTTTKAVKKLIDANYVYKELDKQDKRGYNIMPTDKALKIYDLIIEEENRNIEVCFKGFSEEEKEIAITLIEKMSKNIEEDWVRIKNRGGK